MKTFFNKILRRDNPTRDSKFSRFFRETPISEQERLIGEVVRKSTEDQRALINEYERLSQEGKIKTS